MKSPSKNCELDLILTALCKDIINELAPVLADLINTSLQQGIFSKRTQKSSSLTTTLKCDP